MCCIFRAAALLQLLLTSLRLSQGSSAEKQNCCSSLDRAPDPLCTSVLISEEAEDLTTQKPEPVHIKISLQAPSVFLCNLPCPPQPVTFSKKYSRGKMEIVNQAFELFENNLFQREYRLQTFKKMGL